MSAVNREFIERYQKLWEMDKESRAFAPLAEAYRKDGKLEEALQVCRYGIHRHPLFSGGWLQLAKIYIDMRQSLKAIEALKKAAELAPENIQAHTLLADLYLQEKKPKEALKSFKMVLLLHPDNTKAKKTIARLESLTADEYSPEVFQIEPNEEMFELSSHSIHPFDQEMDAIFPDLKTDKKGVPKPLQQNKAKNENDFAKLHTKTITLVEALLVRNEFAKAQAIIDSFILKWGSSKELDDLKAFLQKQNIQTEEGDSVEILHPSLPLEAQKRHKKIQTLEKLLEKIKNNES